MLSILLYGRNDNHGYNYHKRLALSLNALAHTLTDPEDEILFTDYNSFDDLPTLIESIEDTLSEKTKSLLRIFRVRPEMHKRVSHSHLSVIEPIARNVALARSNPSNKWVLSTNPDMLIVPCDENQSLSEIVAKLPKGFYGLPRFELPERFWEIYLDRMDPEKNFALLRSKTARLNLDTIVRAESFVKYDGPGDFQLFLREDLFRLNGFDEKMQHGWHVDSNLNKRASMILPSGESLEHLLLAFHCNHTQQISFLHKKNTTQNSMEEFVYSPHLKPVPDQKNWGLADISIEEFRLEKKPFHLDSLLKVISQIEPSQKDFHLGKVAFNDFKYNSFRIFTFLTDHLIHLPKTAPIAYFGWNEKMIESLNTYLQEMGFENPLFSSLPGLCPKIKFASVEELAEKSSIFIFDFGFDSESLARSDSRLLKKIMDEFFELLRYSHLINPQIKWIGINIEHTDFKLVFETHLSTHRCNFISGISFGYLPEKKEEEKSKKKFKNLRTLKRNLLVSLKLQMIRYSFNHLNKIRKIRRFLGKIKHKCLEAASIPKDI